MANIFPATLNTECSAVNGKSSIAPFCSRHQTRSSAAFIAGLQHGELGIEKLLACAGRRAVLLKMRRNQLEAIAQRRGELVWAVALDRKAAAAGRPVRAECRDHCVAVELEAPLHRRQVRSALLLRDHE